MVRKFGGPEVLEVAEVPRPEPDSGEVLIRIRAAGVNPHEAYVRSGNYGKLPDLPYIPGHDGAGEVVGVGKGVVRYAEGDRVYVSGAPTYAEFAVAPETAVWPLPDRLTYEQGAAIGVPFGTAYRAIHFVGCAKPGDWTLIHGASGAVGTAAMQIGAALGLNLVGTVGSEAGRVHVESLRAGAVLVGHDSLQAALELTGGRGFDLIIELAAHHNLGKVLPYLTPKGCVVVVGSRGPVEINARDLMTRDASIRGMMLVGGGPKQLAQIHWGLGAGLANGTLSPIVGASFPLEQAPEAHQAIFESGRVGNVVLTVS